MRLYTMRMGCWMGLDVHGCSTTVCTCCTRYALSNGTQSNKTTKNQNKTQPKLSKTDDKNNTTTPKQMSELDLTHFKQIVQSKTDHLTRIQIERTCIEFNRSVFSKLGVVFVVFLPFCLDDGCCASCHPMNVSSTTFPQKKCHFVTRKYKSQTCVGTHLSRI